MLIVSLYHEAGVKGSKLGVHQPTSTSTCRISLPWDHRLVKITAKFKIIDLSTQPLIVCTCSLMPPDD